MKLVADPHGIADDGATTMDYTARDLDLRIASTTTWVGVNSECVSLVRAWTNAPPSSTWVKGAAVKGNGQRHRGGARRRHQRHLRALAYGEMRVSRVTCVLRFILPLREAHHDGL